MIAIVEMVEAIVVMMVELVVNTAGDVAVVVGGGVVGVNPRYNG